MAIRYGYARVTTKENDIKPQLGDLQLAGCQKIECDDGRSGATISKRPVLVALRKKLRPGDTLTVCALDRLARSMRDLMTMMDEFQKRGVQFRSLREGINTGGADGRLTFTVFKAMAQFEHDMIVERTRTGMAQPGAKKPGRQLKLDAAQRREAREMLEAGKTCKHIAHMMRVDRSTLYRTLRNYPAIPSRKTSPN